MKQLARQLWFILPAILVGMIMIRYLSPPDNTPELSYSAFLEKVQANQVSSVRFLGDGYSVEGLLQDGSTFRSLRPIGVSDSALISDLYSHSVHISGEEPKRDSIWTQLLVASFPLLLLIGLFFLFMRNSQVGRNNPLNFGSNRAKMMQGGKVTTNFKDVAGCDEAVEEVRELVLFLKDPSRFQKLGARIPRGVMMIGPPGTGKTLLARAIAGEANVNFFSISGSDFVEMFVGVGASRVRNMFEQAHQFAPCIVFIDEIDAVGRHRGAGLGGGHDEREQTLNQLLVEMDGFEPGGGVIVMAATNRPDVLDPALLRPGRFDRQVVVDLPDIKGRTDILKLHLKKASVADTVDASVLARGTPGFSGADLANVVNEAALFAARANKPHVTQKELEQARDKVMMGVERHSVVLSDEDKRLTAYHEAGHALVGHLVGDHDPVHKVSIIPRGRALGVTVFLPEEDHHSQTRKAVLARICSLYGGRCAEELVFGEDAITTGASNDIQVATNLARNMVTKWGLSPSLGPIRYEEDSADPFLGRRAATDTHSMSDETARKIDSEVTAIIEESYKRAMALLKKNKTKLEKLAAALIERETLEASDINLVMDGSELPPMPENPTKPRGDFSGDFKSAATEH